MKKMLITLVSLMAIGYIVICANMYLMQRQLMYRPEKLHTNPDPSEWGAHDMTVVNLTTEDGLQLKAWYKSPEPNKLTLLYLHGNAGHLGNRINKLRPLLDYGYGLLLLSYRGYGGNPGNPTEQGLYLDAHAAMHFLQQQGIPSTHILLYGESLGSGVAVQMAVDYPAIAGLVLEAPYTSMGDAAQYHYPFLPARWLVKDQFANLQKIQRVTVPILIMHGEVDDVVPITMGKTLFAAANEPKMARFYPQKNHSEFIESAAQDVLEFVAKYVN